VEEDGSDAELKKLVSWCWWS